MECQKVMVVPSGALVVSASVVSAVAAADSLEPESLVPVWLAHPDSNPVAIMIAMVKANILFLIFFPPDFNGFMF